MNKFYIEFLEGYNRTSNIPNTLFGLKDGDSQASYYRGKKSSYRSKFVNGYMICFLPRQISRSLFLASIPMSTSPCAELQASRHKPCHFVDCLVNAAVAFFRPRITSRELLHLSLTPRPVSCTAETTADPFASSDAGGRPRSLGR